MKGTWKEGPNHCFCFTGWVSDGMDTCKEWAYIYKDGHWNKPACDVKFKNDLSEI